LKWSGRFPEEVEFINEDWLPCLFAGIPKSRRVCIVSCSHNRLFFPAVFSPLSLPLILSRFYILFSPQISPEWFFESPVPCVKSDYFVTDFIFLLCGNPYRSAGFVYTYQTRFIMSSINQH